MSESGARPGSGAPHSRAAAQRPQTVAVHSETLVVPRKDQSPSKPNLIGMSRSELAKAMVCAGAAERQARMRANQVWRWLYNRGVSDFAAMTDLAKEFRSALSENFEIAKPEIVTKQISSDGTRKYLLRIAGGHEVEAVYIPEEDRGTLCISSQVGCTLTCRFCHTGTQKLVRNLTPAEIVGQVFVCRDDMQEWPKPGVRPSDKRRVSNIVLMGMGEPLYNLDNVRDAMHIVMDGEGLSLSRRRITLSTSGVVPEIKRVGEEVRCLLAISLHATYDALRDVLVPINKRWPLETLLQACRDYPRRSNAERITFEYVMLKGINDSDADARQLVRMIAGIPAKINLIPFNPWPNAPYECSDWSRIEAFADIVNHAGYASPVRTPRGRDIYAACGQLKSATQRDRRKRVSL